MSRKRMTYRQAVEAAGIAAALDGLDWAIAGTPPLGLDLEGSDIDIVCAAFDGAAFAVAQGFDVGCTTKQFERGTAAQTRRNMLGRAENAPDDLHSK